MDESIFCPSCHLRNEKDAKYCSFCGASLDPFIRTALTTQSIDTKTEQHRTILDASHMEKVPVGALGLFVLDETEPIIISHGSKGLIIGRSYGDSEDTLVDLSTYGAQQLGVSRRHASISFMDNGFVIKDLGSTNGTWVNNKRLISNEICRLQNNDIINLAWLYMTVCIHPTD